MHASLAKYDVRMQPWRLHSRAQGARDQSYVDAARCGDCAPLKWEARSSALPPSGPPSLQPPLQSPHDCDRGKYSRSTRRTNTAIRVQHGTSREYLPSKMSGLLRSPFMNVGQGHQLCSKRAVFHPACVTLPLRARIGLIGSEA